MCTATRTRTQHGHCCCKGKHEILLCLYIIINTTLCLGFDTDGWPGSSVAFVKFHRYQAPTKKVLSSRLHYLKPQLTSTGSHLSLELL